MYQNTTITQKDTRTLDPSDYSPYAALKNVIAPPPKPSRENPATRSRSRIVKKILKRREREGVEGSPDYKNRVRYEVHTIRYDRDGSKTSERIE